MQRLYCLSLVSLAAGIWFLVASVPSSRGDDAAAAADKSAGEDFPPDVARVTVPEARRQAELLHSAMHSALQLTHLRYYKEDEGLPIPAAVVREMFEDVEDEQPARLRWLVVEGQAMNTDHLAQTQFQHDAVAALKAGKPAYEQVQDGIYRRAGAIRLTNACLKCHVPDRKSTEDRTAGLIIAIPVVAEK